MSNPVLLSSTNHKNLRVKNEPAPASFSLRNSSIVMQEFPHLALEYPLLFTKNMDTGSFVCVSVFGFDEGENLFVENDQWNALYTPLNIKRQPFMVGTQNKPGDDQPQESEHVVLIDEADPRVQEQDGEALFNERGFPTPYLEKMTSMLKALKDGFADTKLFIDKLLELDLIAPTTLKIELINQEQRHIQGFYSIDEGKLQSLSGETIAELHSLNYLKPIYAILTSFGHIYSLIDKKNKKLNAS